MQHERSLIIFKPDCLSRGLVGEILARFEKKGLKLAGCKMVQLNDTVLREHYAHLVDKPFFPGISVSMQRTPVMIAVLEGLEAVEVVRILLGPTLSRKGPVGTIRGDYAMSIQNNLIHASDSIETAQKEISRFFKPDELFNWKRLDESMFYTVDEL